MLVVMVGVLVDRLKGERPPKEGGGGDSLVRLGFYYDSAARSNGLLSVLVNGKALDS